MVRILLGGSPCTFWTILKNRNTREIAAEGQGWELFLNYVMAKEKFKPDYWIYENNESASKDIKRKIAEGLRIERLMHFDSALVSAQHRKRIYGSNVLVEEPKDRGIWLKDILNNDVEPVLITPPRFKETKCRIYDSGKSPTITAATGGWHIPRALLKGFGKDEVHPDNYKELTRELTVQEVCRLQTMPDRYTDILCKTKAMSALGNCWTAEMIIHIMKAWNIPKDEPIVAVSMYDGIGTGRYCLDRLGYKNVKYYAYEIDKNSIKCASANYPDIVQLGDAFSVRDKNDICKMKERY